MEHTKETPNQLSVDDGATEIPAGSGFGYTAIPVLATGNIRAPVSLPTLLPPTSDPHRAEHLNNLQQRLQIFWESQRQQVEQTTNFKNHCVPLARIKKIMRADEDVNMIAKETPVLFAKAVEMFIIDMTLRAWTHTEEDKRRNLQPRDIAAAISESQEFDFLADVVPNHLSKPTMTTIPEAPDQQYAVGQQADEANMGLPQLPPPLEPFFDWRQQFAQESESQEQAFVPWAPQPQQNDQESSVPLAPQPQLDDNEEF